MKVTIDFGNEIDPAIQRHLEKGESVQSYIKASLEFFNNLLRIECSGKMVGYGDASVFTKYNTKVSPSNYLETANNRRKEDE